MKMKPTGTQTGFSWGAPGCEYLLDSDGTIEVPDDAVEVARSHGFRPVTEASDRRVVRRPKAER